MTRITAMRGAVLAAALSLAAVCPAAAQSPAGSTIGGQFVAAFQPAARFGLGVRLTASVTGWLGVDSYLNAIPFRNSSGGVDGFIEFAVGPRFRVFSGHRWAVYLGVLPGLMTSTVGSGGTSSFFFEPEGTVEYRLPHRWLWRASFGELLSINQGQFRRISQFTTGLAYRF